MVVEYIVVAIVYMELEKPLVLQTCFLQWNFTQPVPGSKIVICRDVKTDAKNGRRTWHGLNLISKIQLVVCYLLGYML